MKRLKWVMTIAAVLGSVAASELWDGIANAMRRLKWVVAGVAATAVLAAGVLTTMQRQDVQAFIAAAFRAIRQ